MKRLFLFLVCAAAGLLGASATQPFYVNNGTVTTAFQIDATNFVNNGLFSVVTTALYDFSNVQNYSNRNTMIGSPGFRFDNTPSGAGQTVRSRYFVNANLGPNAQNALIQAASEIDIAATNVINKGLLTVPETGLVRLTGDKVDISRGDILVGNAAGSFAERTALSPEGIYDTYWSSSVTNVNTIFPLLNLGSIPRSTPFAQVTTLAPFSFLGSPYVAGTVSLIVSNPGLQSVESVQEFDTNRTVHIVFFRQANTNIQTRIRFLNNTPFSLGTTMIEWSLVSTNIFNQRVTNFLYLTDTFGVRTNGFTSHFPSGNPPATFQPDNFTLTRAKPVLFEFGVAGTVYPTGGHVPAFWSTNPPALVVASNRYSAYGVRLTPATFDPVITQGPPDRSFDDRVRQLTGRVEVNADKVLDMSLTRIQGLNYVKINATNHFIGSTNAAVGTVFTDVYLGSTNGLLYVTNLLQPLVQRITGEIDLYSGVWTNTVIFPAGGGITATSAVPFSVLYVDARLTNQSPSFALDFDLRSTNIIMSDSINVLSHLGLNAENFTLSSNQTINLLNPDLNWASGVPYLKSFTNYGTINATNELVFTGIGHSPDGSDVPYQKFVNKGQIVTWGNTISADYLEHRGTLSAFFGGNILNAQNALLSGGSLTANFSDISINSGSLVISNTSISAGHGLTFSVTGALDDGGVAGNNRWLVHDGFSLLAKPALGGLAGTIVTNVAFPYADIVSYWAGTDLGAVAAGYTNNGSLGYLILDGALNSQFTFRGNGLNNAMYVDRIDFVNTATNLDASTNLTSVVVDPGMTIYYTKAFRGATDVSAALDGKNGGRLRRVARASLFRPSVTLASDSSYAYDAALVEGTTLPPAVPPAGQFTDANIGLKVEVKNVPSPAALVSWNCVPNSSNHLFVKQGLGGAWTELTSFTAGPACTHATVVDGVNPSGRFYKVRVDAANP